MLLGTIYIVMNDVITLVYFSISKYFGTWFHFTYFKNISRKSTYPGYIEPLSGTRWNKKATKLFA